MVTGGRLNSPMAVSGVTGGAAGGYLYIIGLGPSWRGREGQRRNDWSTGACTILRRGELKAVSSHRTPRRAAPAKHQTAVVRFAVRLAFLLVVLVVGGGQLRAGPGDRQAEVGAQRLRVGALGQGWRVTALQAEGINAGVRTDVNYPIGHRRRRRYVEAGDDVVFPQQGATAGVQGINAVTGTNVDHPIGHRRRRLHEAGGGVFP